MSSVRRHSDEAGRAWCEVTDGWWFRDAVLRLPELCPDRPFLVVAAPPGSGRGRLVRHWLRPAPSWTHIGLGVRPGSREGLLEEDVEPAIRRHLLQNPGGFIVLDGVEALTPGELERIVTDFPPGPRLILVGRGEVLPPATAVRLAGRVAEVRAGDLWWPVEVVRSQLAELCGVRIDAEQAGRLHRLSGGWPAGVLALGREGAPEADPVLTGRVLADLVAGLLLSGIPSDLEEFVLATAPLPGLAADPELCAALVPGADPVVMSDTARRWGLTLDQWPAPAAGRGPDSARPEPAVGGYHPWLVVGARRTLARLGRPPAGNLLRAGDLASSLARPDAAVPCYLEARAWPQVLVELERAAPQGFSGWDTSFLHATLTALPAPAWAGNPGHRALIALAAAICGDRLLSAEVLARPAEVPWWHAATGLIAALGNDSTPGAGRVPGAGGAPVPTAALPAFFGLHDTDALTAARHLLAARHALFAAEPDSAAEHLGQAWAAGAEKLPRYLLLAGLGVEALAAAWGGELSAAQRLADRARRLAGQTGSPGQAGRSGRADLSGHPMLATAVLAEAETLRARGEPGQALLVLDGSADVLGADFVVGVGEGPAVGGAYRVLRARLLLDLGDPGARDELERLRQNGDEHLPPALAARLALGRSRLAELDGDLAAAQAELEAAPAVPCVLSARLFLALRRQQASRARDLLDAWSAETGLDDRLRRTLAEAALALAAGRRGAAAEAVNTALLAAEPDGHLRVFLDGPAALRTLISTALRRSPDASHWRRTLIGRLDEAGAAADGGSGVTRRELVVLEQLTTDRTHAQIAAALFVSENTLKSHCRNLYRKLGVHSREEAVRIARVRGWLSPRGDVVVDVNITRTPDIVEL
ncbi:hypothetical protein KIH74_29285 [Kineosporia sp. J2-2]|uniref:HTH luxR-type domain-containing protein n=1 Tax=Kineosporia corallincola TaxID=2835133 RepID=A0ABS5TPN6_9ACTN|nr:LuxR C-terminal-related transcriptional regulator [Kineosporia corallincola]MBT0773073.1 hypothetical protein [Kineosporia corallincola]